MKWISEAARLLRVLLLTPFLFALSAQAQDAKPFSKEQLDQMTAQVALYPDSLLAQLLHGHDLSGGFRRGRGVVEGASGCEGRRRREDGRERALGSVGRVAGRVSRRC